MKRLILVAGVLLVLGSLAAVPLFVTPEGGREPGPGRPPAEGDGRAAARVPTVVEPAARALLERAASAPATTVYTGTQFVSAWTSDGDVAHILDVDHHPRQGTTWRPVGGHAAVAPPVHEDAAVLPSLFGTSAVSLIARHYSLLTAGSARVAGRTTELVEAIRVTGAAKGSVAARFWIDARTGLVLRREVYDERGRPTRASGFVSVQATRWESPRADAAESPRSARPMGEALDGADVASLRVDGWHCPAALPGPLPLVDARRSHSRLPVLHLSYADGISAVSLFQQRGRLDQDLLSGYGRESHGGQQVWVRQGVPVRVVWSNGDRVYTLVADAPERTVDRAVTLLVRRYGDDGPGAWDRLGRGLGRVASWFNPMD